MRQWIKNYGIAALLTVLPLCAHAADTKTAVFAGGCFWSMQHAFEGTDGVTGTKAGYAGGRTTDPTYEKVETGATGHHEAVQVTYDPAKISYQRLLDIYWRNTDPMDAKGQFCDKGEQYQPVIFADDVAEKSMAEKEKADLAKKFGKPIATEVRDSAAFYPAEDYHQGYADKHPIAYGAYREGCGRPGAMRAIWGGEAGGEAFKKMP